MFLDPPDIPPAAIMITILFVLVDDGNAMAV